MVESLLTQKMQVVADFFFLHNSRKKEQKQKKYKKTKFLYTNVIGFHKKFFFLLFVENISLEL